MQSPYLAEHRLADILAAIQVMGSHVWDSRPLEHWKPHLGAEPQSTTSWEVVFAQHPEFFGTQEWEGRQQYFLRLRRAYERTVDPVSLKEISDQQLQELKAHDGYATAKLARRALTPLQVEALMKTAIELQDRASALADRTRWWIPLAAALLAFLGAVLGSILKGPT